MNGARTCSCQSALLQVYNIERGLYKQYVGSSMKKITICTIIIISVLFIPQVLL